LQKIGLLAGFFRKTCIREKETTVLLISTAIVSVIIENMNEIYARNSSLCLSFCPEK